MTETTNNSALTVLVVAGGTAGHIEPALAVAEAVEKLYSRAACVFVGTPQGMENRLVTARGFEIRHVNQRALPRRLNTDLVATPFRLVKNIRVAASILRKESADIVVGFGGYVCVPVFIAAGVASTIPGRKKIPVIVHEANARKGITTTLGSKWADRVLAAFENTGLDAEVVGNPVRDSIASLDREGLQAQARDYFELPQDKPVVLVVGGSQGAQRLNTACEQAADAMTDAGVAVLHAHGMNNTVNVSEKARKQGYIPTNYIDRMDLAYAAADIIVCRSGAMTVAEVEAVGLPAVFVPLPHGNGEQRLNCAHLVAAGSAEMIEDDHFTSDYVLNTVVAIANDKTRIAEMSRNAAQRSGPTVAEKIAGIVLDSAGVNRAQGD